MLNFLACCEPDHMRLRRASVTFVPQLTEVPLTRVAQFGDQGTIRGHHTNPNRASRRPIISELRRQRFALGRIPVREQFGT